MLAITRQSHVHFFLNKMYYIEGECFISTIPLRHKDGYNDSYGCYDNETDEMFNVWFSFEEGNPPKFVFYGKFPRVNVKIYFTFSDIGCVRMHIRSSTYKNEHVIPFTYKFIPNVTEFISNREIGEMT